MKPLWQPPSPSTAFEEGVTFRTLGGRTCSLSFRYEDPGGEWVPAELRFNQVVAFKCTYLPGLSAEMIESAYDKLVEVPLNAWLEELAVIVGRRSGAAKLRHLRICFDDGPCYDFICEGFETVGAEEMPLVPAGPDQS